MIGKAGGTPFIPPKKFSKPDRDGETIRKMFHQFALHRDEWLRSYHQRSNVESAFSMIKLKFGDAVRSKTPTAMGNEVLAKVLCHNHCCLNQEADELGIKFRLPKQEAADSDTFPTTIPFAKRVFP